ncbi:hypothetical protein BWI17_11415 [Betaproteobacteria bacterium GR16-43]|nr:hypothetical protein BWI17_11415 [Betaproteobacteria bacterium GR16-43]
MIRALLFACCFVACLARAGGIADLFDSDPEKFFRKVANEHIQTLKKARDPAAREEAADSLGGTKYPEGIEALAAALSDPAPNVRIAAAGGLWKSGDPAAKPARDALVKALGDPDSNVVAQAAGALQSIGMSEKELVPANKRVFDSKDATITSRFLVARNLIGNEPSARLLDVMIAYLERWATDQGDAAEKNTELAKEALEDLAETKDRSLLPTLMREARNIRGGKIVLLKTIALYQPPPDGWRDLLVGFLSSPNPKEREAGLYHLRAVKKEADVVVWAPRAAALLDDRDKSVRSGALSALGSAGGLASAEIDRVVASLRDSDKYVRRSAARAIGEMGDPKQPVSAAAKSRVAAVGKPALTLAAEKDADADVRDEAKSALKTLAGNSETVAAATPSSMGAEGAGLAVLRERNITFEQGSFYRALQQADVEVVRALLDAGMTPNDGAADMGSPMRMMLFFGNHCSPKVRPTKPATKEMIKLLLERGADVNAADQNGNTTLMQAMSKGCDRELIRMLLKAGAKKEPRNASGLDAFEFGLIEAGDGLEELIAAGYRMPAARAKDLEQGYKDQPKVVAMIRKATKK